MAAEEPGTATVDPADERGDATIERQHEGLAGTFHEKAIRLDTMELRLLLPTAVAIAIVVGGAVLLGVRGLAWPEIGAGTGPGSVLMTVPLPIAILSAIALVLAWSFILAGALHAHLAFRIVGVGAYVVVGLASALQTGSAGLAVIVLFVLLSVVVAAVGLYVTDRGNHHQAPHLHHRSRLRLPTFLWILMATTLIYGLVALHGFESGNLAAFIFEQLDVYQFFLIPVLLLAGTDFAEWAEVVSGRLSSLFEQVSRPALVAALVVAALAILFVSYGVRNGFGFSFSPLGTVLSVAPVVVIAIPVVAIGGFSLTRQVSAEVPFWALVVGALVLYAGLLVGSALPSPPAGPATPADLPPLVASVHGGEPEFRLLVPAGWRESETPEGRVWSGTFDGHPARLLLLWDRPPAAGLSSALGLPADVGPLTSDGDWHRAEVSTRIAGRAAGGDLWTRSAAGRTWTLVGLSAGGRPAADGLFDTVRESWSPSTEPAAENGVSAPPQNDLIAVGVSSVVLLGLGLALLLTGRGERATGGLFLSLCALFTAAGPLVLYNAVQLLRVRDFLTVSTDNLMVTAAYAALITVIVTSIVRRWRLPVPVLRLLFVLLVGFAGLEFLYAGVFETVLNAGARFGLVQGVVLVAAMLWDVLMSGESFTNTGGLRVPRHSRVLIYLGYTVLVVLAVLFLTSLQVQGGGEPGTEFESDTWPEVGIAALGPPLLLTFFFANFSAWRRNRPMGRPDSLDQVDRSVLQEASDDD